MSVAGSAVAKIPKPNMRRLLENQIKKHIAISFGIAIVLSTSFKFLVADKRKEAYVNFYRTYDPEKAFERMQSKKLFQSC